MDPSPFLRFIRIHCSIKMFIINNPSQFGKTERDIFFFLRPGWQTKDRLAVQDGSWSSSSCLLKCDRNRREGVAQSIASGGARDWFSISITTQPRQIRQFPSPALLTTLHWSCVCVCACAWGGERHGRGPRQHVPEKRKSGLILSLSGSLFHLLPLFSADSWTSFIHQSLTGHTCHRMDSNIAKWPQPTLPLWPPSDRLSPLLSTFFPGSWSKHLYITPSPTPLPGHACDTTSTPPQVCIVHPPGTSASPSGEQNVSASSPWWMPHFCISDSQAISFLPKVPAVLGSSP